MKVRHGIRGTSWGGGGGVHAAPPIFGLFSNIVYVKLLYSPLVQDQLLKLSGVQICHLMKALLKICRPISKFTISDSITHFIMVTFPSHLQTLIS